MSNQSNMRRKVGASPLSDTLTCYHTIIERQLFAAFSEVGSDLEESDIEFAIHAQSEVVS